MSFYNVYEKYKDFEVEEFFEKVTENDVLRSLNKDRLDQWDLLTLLSPQASKFLEPMARKAQRLTQQHFGKSILLFTPMYLSNYCTNRCVYCTYNAENHIFRKRLSMEEIEIEAAAIAKTGLQHILILTGGSREITPVEYIVDSVQVLKKYFTSISIEIYALTQDEYKKVVNAGVDGFTIYQEVYNEEIYDKVHLSGEKKNYRFRIDAPERACKAGMRTVNIGALLGLNKWRKEAFITGLHADYLQNKYPEVDISISPPRIRPHVGVFDEVYHVDDPSLLQIMFAYRLFIPRAGITISTRESAEFRNNILSLGVTKMSAGVSTEVGGHTTEEHQDPQFEIADNRNVEEMRDAILARGYQPIFKDWMPLADEALSNY
ncbi:tyrosine lyase ThiH [Desulfonispora thiosulfatigenes DSM 11270]|uniref:Tyrosine lyase ThiH n=1 Tax=Desulfonispora thiosulfatigenes DSM 11270 TaxID=656914 RepID=A0A1W1V2Q7_DESTI|nr:2-iminoacetate synthase ThiH [Desulfonispora thiosulfatigenes]SMB87311.1 tyrosine lyase ThiH [Desulfonispora thiosulfatigenes DSM 11270]